MKKITLFLFTLLVGLLVISGFNVKADSVVTLTDGAQVRTAGEYQGLRFQASVDTLEGTTEHGFFIALGEHSLFDMTTAIEAESATVGANKLVKKATTGADLTFAVTVYDITNTYYTTGITAVAYVYNGSAYTFSSAKVTRNIAEVALKAFNDGNDSELIETVVNYVDTNYYAVNFSGSTRFYIAGGFIYTNDVSQIAQKFLADWQDYNNAIDISTLKKAFSSDNKASIRAFAIADNTGARKWHWMWEYLYSLNTTPYKAEIKDLALDNGSVTDDSGYTILYVVYNFFANASWKVDIAGDSINDRELRFWSHPEYYTQLSTYNDKVKGNYIGANTKYVSKGGSYTLPEYTLVEKDYYTATGWNDGTNTYTSGESYTLSAEKVFTPVYTADTYTVTYMDGETNVTAQFDNSKKSYTYESAAITLPTYEKPEYIFLGWYDNAELTGQAVTNIPTKSHGNKTYYAKTIVNNFSEVGLTLNLNGGYWFDYNADTIANLRANFRTDAKSKGNSWDSVYGNAAAEDAFNITSSILGTTVYKWDGLLAYFEDVNPNAQMIWFFNYYRTNHSIPSRAVSQEAGYDQKCDTYYLSYDAWQWYYAQSAVKTNGTGGNGRWIITAGDVYDGEILDDVMAKIVAAQTNNFTILGPTLLPTPYKEGSTFVGWYDNPEFTGDAITTYPGVSEENTTATLYAKWN